MKRFELTIKWDRLRNGNFPSKQLEVLGCNVESRREDIFKELITISMDIEEDEDQLEIAYELGATVQALITK